MASIQRLSSNEWPQQDFIKLLAHLDLIVEGPKTTFTDADLDERKKEVLIELEEKLDHQYTSAQIETKLWDEYRDGYQWPEDNFPRLFILGSYQIHTLDDTTRSLVRYQLEKIRASTPRSRRCKSVQPPISTRKQKRCSSAGKQKNNTSTAKRKKHVSTSKLPFKIQKHRSSPRKPIPRKTPVPVRQTRSVSMRRIALPDEVSTSHEEDCEPQQSIDDRPIHASIEKGQSSLCFNDEPRESSSRLAIRNSTAPPSSFELDPRQRSPCALPADLKRDDESTIAGSSRMSTPSPMNSTPSNGAHDYDELMWNVAHYQHRCEKAEEDYKNLERDMRQNKSFLLATKGIPDAIRKELEKKNLDIATLKRRQRNQEHLKPYLTLEQMSTVFPSAEEFHTAFTDMRSNFDSLSVIPGFRLLPANLVRNLPEASDLQELLVYVLGEELESADQKLLQRFLGAPANAMVQALTGAAVCQWVFRSELRCMELTNTSLLQKYRECIEEICGEDVASKLNSAAHQKVFKDAHFKEIAIPRIAAKHTQRLLDALHPLIDDKWRSRTTSKLREYLEGIFYCGIQAKCLTWVGKEDYEWIWHPCYSPFERGIMQTEGSNTTSEQTHVRLPLVPGFRVHRNNGETGEVNLLKKQGKPLEHPGILMKALVLV